jgi:hypothetical protein
MSGGEKNYTLNNGGIKVEKNTFGMFGRYVYEFIS